MLNYGVKSKGKYTKKYMEGRDYSKSNCLLKQKNN